jgi:dipeptidyl aminopeptidase/acylaminoacyl peptidase
MRLLPLAILVRTRFCFACLAVLLIGAQVSDAQGLSSTDLSRLRSVGSAEISPDGHRIAYRVTMRDRPGRPYSQLWIMDVDAKKSVRVGGDKDSGGSPLWSPDGKWLAFDGHQGEKGGLFVARPDGSDVTLLASPAGTNSPLPGTGKEFTWSPDGKQLAFISATPGAPAHLRRGFVQQAGAATYPGQHR